MQGTELVGAGILLLGTVAVGLIAHELTHAVVLRTLGVPYDIHWFPGSEASTLAGGLTGTWAAVTPRTIPADVPTWGIQLSATAPLVLAVAARGRRRPGTIRCRESVRRGLDCGLVGLFDSQTAEFLRVLAR